MTAEQNEIANKLLKYHQQHSTIDWEYFDSEADLNIPYKKANPVIHRLKEFGLIEDFGTNQTIITSKGETTPCIAAYYRNEKKHALTKSREDWYKRNWIFADILKYAIGAAVGSAITASTILLTCNQNKHQAQTEQSLSKPTDTSNKK